MADVEHERSDIDVRRVLLAGAAILGAIVVALAVGWGIIELSGGTQPPAYGPPRSLQPQLEPHPLEDVEAYRARGQRVLTSYGHVDQCAGVVRFPIERAMDILADRKDAKSAAPVEPKPTIPAPSKPTPRDVQQRVGLDQHLGARIPLAATLRDEHG